MGPGWGFWGLEESGGVGGVREEVGGSRYACPSGLSSSRVAQLAVPIPGFPANGLRVRFLWKRLL
jgi:hypothetical protein